MNLTDPYGVRVEENKKCAYNYQGQVRLGRITDIGHINRRNIQRIGKVVISIKEEMTQNISKVSNPKNLVILPG
jgi:hypothetical protein